ncbi:MAG TPA: hypothetical protein VK747_07020 [Blastocatellia bacterium]|nr:hypothetical protein [Blastocatellia bacterium]
MHEPAIQLRDALSNGFSRLARFGLIFRSLYGWIRRGRLQLMEDAGGHTLICKQSLIGPYTKRH